jgi:hypothetical protein
MLGPRVVLYVEMYDRSYELVRSEAALLPSCKR